MLNGKKNGTFLEIGAHHGQFTSNTFLLEREFNWFGLSIDIDPSVTGSFNQYGRSSKILISDALELDYQKLQFDLHWLFLSLQKLCHFEQPYLRLRKFFRQPC